MYADEADEEDLKGFFTPLPEHLIHINQWPDYCSRNQFPFSSILYFIAFIDA